jgi:hypothetical protein
MEARMADAKTLVVYFSRSGVTQRAAETLGATLHADLERIVDRTNRAGPLGFLRSVVEALRRRTAPIEPATRDPASYTLVVVATPVWAWSVSSPVRAYLTNVRARLPEVAFLCTMGARGEARAFAEMTRIAGKAPRAVCALNARQAGSQEGARLIARFAAELGAPQP